MSKELWIVFQNTGEGDELKPVLLKKGSNWKDAMTEGFGDGWAELSDDLSEAKQECFDGDMSIDAIKIPQSTIDELNS